MHPDQYCFFPAIMASIFSTYFFWKSALATSCPDLRRADNTNNRHFYYCIDLPFSAKGHVWIPATCNYGLVFHPVLKMCVLPQEIPCSNGTANNGNYRRQTFEEKNIESPNTAPDSVVAFLSFLHDLGNVSHQTLHTTSTNNDNTLQFSIKPPHVQSTDIHAMLPDVISHQGGQEKPVTTVTSTIIPTNQIQHISTMEGSSTSLNSFSTGLLHQQWKPALNIPCTTGVRMPNFTDCTKYYTCNFTSGSIISYTCPQNMAFNVHKRVCEKHIYDWCKNQTTIADHHIMSQPFGAISLVTTSRPSLCSKPGKTPDPLSRQHYFVCYFQNEKYVRYRLTCPNTLEFCAPQSICKQQLDCYE